MAAARVGLVLLAAAIAIGFTPLLLLSWPLAMVALLVLRRSPSQRRAATAGMIGFAAALGAGILLGGLVLRDLPLGLAESDRAVELGTLLVAYAPAIALTAYGAFHAARAVRISGAVATLAILAAAVSLAFSEAATDPAQASAFRLGMLAGPLLGVALVLLLVVVALAWRRPEASSS